MKNTTVSFRNEVLITPETLTSQRLKPLSESSSRLKPTNLLAVPFRVLELLDNGFSRWRWGGIETSALLY